MTQLPEWHIDGVRASLYRKSTGALVLRIRREDLDDETAFMVREDQGACIIEFCDRLMEKQDALREQEEEKREEQTPTWREDEIGDANEATAMPRRRGRPRKRR